MARITKEELINAVSAAVPGCTKKDVESVVNATFSVITSNLAAGNTVPVSGFGVFSVKRRGERTGRNPKTKESIIIPAQTVPAFSAGGALKDAVRDTKVEK